MLASNWKNKRRKTPTLLQMEALECGAAALGIILGYYGLYVPLEQLREDCGINRNGSKASNILKAARAYGMVGSGYRMELKHLTTIEMPVILFWGFNHFVVLEGFQGEKVYLNDPATGAKVISYEEFNNKFTGVLIKLAPGSTFKPGGSKPSVIKTLGSRLAIGKQGVIFAILAGLVLVIPGLVIPFFSKIFIDNVLVSGSKAWFKPLLLGMFITATLRAILSWIQGQALLRQQTKVAVLSATNFFHHILRLPLGFFTQRYGGEISNRIPLNDTVANLLTGTLATTFISAFTAVFFVSIMLLYDVLLTGIGVLFAVTNIFVLKWVNRKRSDLQQRILQENGKLAGISINGLYLIETIKASSSESDFFSRWSGQMAKLRNAFQEMERWTNFIMPVPNLISGLSTAAVLGFGALRVMDGHMTIGMLVAFQSLMASFLAPFNQIVQLGTELQTLQGNINRIDDVLKYNEDTIYEQNTNSEQPIDKTKLLGLIEISNLHFGYAKLDAPLIKDFNLTVKPGSRVALVGGSGSGKSTIAKLICGLLKPLKGTVRFDGKLIQEIPRNVFVTSVSFVDQDIVLFQGTIQENITLWNNTIPIDKIIQAAKDACIHETIATRPGSYDAIMDENGTNLSGGQRQRIEIARALVTDPSILVLDEATSSLDANTEMLIDNNLRRRGCTCIIVAHRLSTIRDCDEIIVLEQGKIIQRGTHDELIDQGGLYKKLIEN